MGKSRGIPSGHSRCCRACRRSRSSAKHEGYASCAPAAKYRGTSRPGNVADHLKQRESVRPMPTSKSSQHTETPPPHTQHRTHGTPNLVEASAQPPGTGHPCHSTQVQPPPLGWAAGAPPSPQTSLGDVITVWSHLAWGVHHPETAIKTRSPI